MCLNKIIHFLNSEFFRHFFLIRVHPENILVLSMTLEIFHSEILGKSFSSQHSLNIKLILNKLEVFHLEILGNFSILSHLENILVILVTFNVFHLEISGKAFKFSHFENIKLILHTEETFHPNLVNFPNFTFGKHHTHIFYIRSIPV